MPGRSFITAAGGLLDGAAAARLLGMTAAAEPLDRSGLGLV